MKIREEPCRVCSKKTIATDPEGVHVDYCTHCGSVQTQVTLMRRNKFEMKIAILEALQGNPLRTTHVMRKANINCNVLCSLIEFLLKRGFIERMDDEPKNQHRKRNIKHYSSKFFHLTEKGHKALTNYNLLKELTIDD